MRESGFAETSDQGLVWRLVSPGRTGRGSELAGLACVTHT